jgi:hypothetical protein
LVTVAAKPPALETRGWRCAAGGKVLGWKGSSGDEACQPL